MNNNTTLNYRGINYECIERIAWDNQKWICYECDDQELLKGLNTMSFSAISEDSMRGKIDNFIDNKEELLESARLTHNAAIEFYKDSRYQGD